MSGCTKILPQNWKQIAYVTKVYKLQSIDFNCKTYKDDKIYVRINESNQKVISEVGPSESTYCATSGEPIDIRRREGINKELCLEYCTKEACKEIASEQGDQQNWNFENAEWDNESNRCECWCTPYNTSNIINILE